MLTGGMAIPLLVLLALASGTPASSLERIDAIELAAGENILFSAVIDPTGEFAYFGTETVPGRVVKIDLETFERIDAISLEGDEDALSSAVIDPTGEFAYFGTYTVPGRVVKIDLATFARVDAISLESGEDRLRSAVIDPAGEFAYFGTDDFPGRVVKIDLETFARVDAIPLESGEDRLFSAVIDPPGDFAYFGTGTVPGQVVKIDLGTFERLDAIPLESGEDSLVSAVIDPTGELAYFGTGTSPGWVVEIDLGTFERVNAIPLETNEDALFSAAIDLAGDFAYFGTLTSPGRVVRVALGDVLSPVGLTVDAFPLLSDGNQVFEPGECVEVAPAWLWLDSPDLLGGAASAFVGPDGPAYDLIIDSAFYGTVEPGEVVNCRETGSCYAVQIGPSGVTRPATHWDAILDEELFSKGGGGGFGTWTLHLGESFADVPRSSPFYRWVETLLHHGVTSGCSAAEYCPSGANSRAQMPVFVLKAAEGANYVPPACIEGEEVFVDVPATSPFCPWIEELARRGVIAGCGGGSYCPGDPVTRAQMAVFLLKTIEGAGYTPPPCGGTFTDVPCPSTFADWIEELFVREIASGCSSEPPAYCPGTPVSRAQMAVLVTKAFGLALYGP